MTTNDILKQMEKEFYDNFVSVNGVLDCHIDEVIEFGNKFIRTLLESFGEEIIGDDLLFGHGRMLHFSDEDAESREKLRDEQRLKVKEILSNLK